MDFQITKEKIVELSHATKEPQWFTQMRLEALTSIPELELPKVDKTKITKWDFTSYNELLVHAADTTHTSKSNHSLFVQRDNTVIKNFVNDEAKEKGVVVSSFIDALGAHEELLKKHFMRCDGIRANSHKLAAIHTALINGGVFVYVPKNVILETPIEVVFELNNANANQVNHVVVIAEENSQFTIVENYLANKTATKQVNHVTEVFVGRNSNVTYSVIEQLPAETNAYINRSAYTARDARMNWAFGIMNNGNTIAENTTLLRGEGSSADVKTVVVGTGEQKQNFTTKVSHHAKNTTGNILNHAVVKDSATNIFNGIGFIEKGASKSNAQQSSRVLMLSEKARGDANPILLIDEDDVMAGHAASVGKVDDEQLYYLMSRGISRSNAERMLVLAFLEPVVKEMPLEEIKNRLVSAIHAKL